jgi:hypothetical protein
MRPTLTRGRRKKIMSVKANVRTAMPFVNQKNAPVIRAPVWRLVDGASAGRAVVADAVLPVKW